MLLIANESANRARPLADTVRELSLTPMYFASAATLNDLISGKARRIVLLSEDDLTETIIDAVATAGANGRIGIIIAVDRKAPRVSGKVALLDRIDSHENLEWLDPDYDFTEISNAARSCRRRMLRISREAMEAAIAENQLIVQYQPKVERSAGTEWQTQEAEALLRWRHPALGIVGPLEFLPEVEEFGLIEAVSEFVLEEAARQLAAWRDCGLDLSVCINLASSLLSHAALPETFAEIIADAGLDCRSFTFEVSAQDLESPDAPYVATLTALRDRGFRICLEDFRVATTSLATFEQLPFDEIKIHASALKRAQQDQLAMTVLAAVTGLAHNLGMSVCATGVEDQETFDFLATIECDKMQGFFISEAVMPDILRRVYGPKADAIGAVA